MNTMDNILSKIPPATKIVRFITKQNDDSDEVQDNELNITGVEVSDLSSVAIPNVVACNIILNCFLACFGIDVCSIAREAVASTDFRLVDMQNLLIHSKWETTSLTINSVSKTAIEWVETLFHIYSKENFINQLYRRINDICLKGENTDDSVVINTDDETYQMIKFIALCFGANVGFSSIPLGDTSTVVVEFDGWHLWDMLDGIGEILEAEGLIEDKTQVQHSIAFAQRFNHGVGSYVDVTDPDDPVFTSEVQCNLVIHKYPSAHIGYGGGQYSTSYTDNFPYGEGENVWYLEIFVTQKSVGTIAEIVYGTPSVARSLNAGNIYGQTGNNSWYYGTGYADINFYNDSHNIINARVYGSWLIRSMRYYVEGYTGNLLSQTTFYTDYRPNEGDNSIYFAHNPSNEYFYQNTPYPFYGSEYGVQGTEEIETPIVGNTGSVEVGETVPVPSTDDTILQQAQNIDLLDTNWFKRITLTVEGILSALKTIQNFIDTTVKLKTDLININTGVSIRDGKPLTKIKEDLELDYVTKYTSLVPYENHADAYRLMMSQRTYVLNNITQLNNFNAFLWDKDFFDVLTETMYSYKPLDCIESVIGLPFMLNMNEDIDAEETLISCGGYYMSLPNAQAKGHLLKNFTKVLRTNPVAIGSHKVRTGNTTEKDVYEPESYLNYEPYTTASIYIPFVGERKLDMSLIMYKWVFLEYKVFIPTGDFVVTVNVYDKNDSVSDGETINYGMIGVEGKKRAYPILTATGNMAFSQKITGKGNINGLGAISQGLSALSMAGAGMVGGAIVQGLGAMQSLSSVNHMETAGSSYNQMTGILSNWKPYITIFKHEAIRGYTTDTMTAFNQTMGKKSERGIKIKHMGKGFHKVKGVKIEGVRCTEQERREIEQILMNGFYKASDPEGSVGEDD